VPLADALRAAEEFSATGQLPQSASLDMRLTGLVLAMMNEPGFEGVEEVLPFPLLG